MPVTPKFLFEILRQSPEYCVKYVAQSYVKHKFDKWEDVEKAIECYADEHIMQPVFIDYMYHILCDMLIYDSNPAPTKKRRKIGRAHV